MNELSNLLALQGVQLFAVLLACKAIATGACAFGMEARFESKLSAALRSLQASSLDVVAGVELGEENGAPGRGDEAGAGVKHLMQVS